MANEVLVPPLPREQGAGPACCGGGAMGLTHATTFPDELRVLVVDDDPTWLSIVAKMLRKCSYEVTTRGLARVALEILREIRNKFDIVISDVNMPDMDGFKLLEHIKHEMDLPVILMSIDGETSRVMKGVQHGACDYLVKPILMKELRIIWRHVYRKKMHEVKGHDNFDNAKMVRNGCDTLEESGRFVRAESDTMWKKNGVDNHATQATETRAVARLNFAEHAMLQWNRSPGADYTNGGLLSAFDEVLQLEEEDRFPAEAYSACSHHDRAVAVAMSRMVEEFSRVRVWNASQLRFNVERLALASSSASAMAFPSASNRSSSTSTGDTSSTTTSTGGEVDSFDGSRSRVSWSVTDELAAVMDGNFLDEVDLICPAGVSVLHEIAQRVIRAGGTVDFLQAFANARCDVLDRLLSILRVECSRGTTEVMVNRWSAVTKILERAVLAMRRQLYAQPSGAFDRFRDEYLLAIAESRILVLLQFAEEFTRVTSHEKLQYILRMYEALSDAAPGLLHLFSGTRKQPVAERTQDILTKLANVVKTMLSGLMTKIRSGSSHMPSTADGVHPLTRYAITRVEQLAPHRTALGLILATGDVDAPAQAVISFGSLVPELILGLERNREEKSAGGSASAHLFMVNNISFVLIRATDADVASLLGNDWIPRRRGQLERHAASYVEASWGPVVACLETSGKPEKALAKFNAAFKEAHGSQMCREVPDPALRAALRKAVSGMVVPAYTAFVQQHPKLERSASYTADDVAERLSELFEGEAAPGLLCS